MKKIMIGIAIVLNVTSDGMSNDEILIGARDVISKTGDTCGISISRDFQLINWNIRTPDTNLIFDVNEHNFSGYSNTIEAKSFVIIANNVIANDLNTVVSRGKRSENLAKSYITSQGDTCNISLSQDFRNDGVINLPSMNLIFNLNGHKFSNYGRIHAKSITIENGALKMGRNSVINAINDMRVDSLEMESDSVIEIINRANIEFVIQGE